MTSTLEILRNIEYVRCTGCYGDRRGCKVCSGWGFIASPASSEERIALGLRALRSSVSLELAPKARKRIRLPLRKQRKK
jgi:hypothetical protein